MICKSMLTAKVNEYIISENEKANITILAAKRMGSSPHPLVKLATSAHTRSLIIDMKGKLKNSRMYQRFFIRPSQTLEHRILCTSHTGGKIRAYCYGIENRRFTNFWQK